MAEIVGLQLVACSRSCCACHSLRTVWACSARRLRSCRSRSRICASSATLPLGRLLVEIQLGQGRRRLQHAFAGSPAAGLARRAAACWPCSCSWRRWRQIVLELLLRGAQAGQPFLDLGQRHLGRVCSCWRC